MDYDIDKAYIMGRSYDMDGTFVRWSNLFDYSTPELLEISTHIPVPKGILLQRVPGYNIDNYITAITQAPTRAKKLENTIRLIYLLEKWGGKYYYTIPEGKGIIDRIQKHEDYKAPIDFRSESYKNIASSNIIHVVHNIRNRDLAYSPITMRDLQKKAEKSPKGRKTKILNSINPFAKYIMQYLNIVGKDVIGIAANGEKVWFNLTYYSHKILREGTANDLKMLLMQKTYNRIKGRSKWVLEPELVRHIPDMAMADEIIRNKLKELFYKDGKELLLEDKYIDQLISLLLSAATDNAKELILARINSGKDLAKYHLHLFIMGFSLDDVVSFMISPAVELVDKYASKDLYSKKDMDINKSLAMLMGKFDISQLYKKYVRKLTLEERFDEAISLAEDMAMIDPESIGNGDVLYPEIIDSVKDVYDLVESKDVNDFLGKYYKAKLGILENEEWQEILLNYTLPTTGNWNTNKIFNYVNLLIDDVNNQINLYNEQFKVLYTIKDFKLDLEEFSRLTSDANETSKLASCWLKLNQGIPQTDIDIIKRLKDMNATVSSREKAIGIYDFTGKNGEKRKKLYIEILQQIIETLSFDLVNKESGVGAVLNNIITNNPMLNVVDCAKILLDSINVGLFGNFDILEFLKNSNVLFSEKINGNYDTNKKGSLIVKYRDLSAQYYNLIKANWNILHIVQKIDHYNSILDLFNYTVLSRLNLSKKSRIIDLLIKLGNLRNENIDDDKYKSLIKYADDLIFTSFILQLKLPIILPQNSTLYNYNFEEYDSDQILLNSINGITSFKRFMENDFIKVSLQDPRVKNNFLILELMSGVNHRKPILRTKLDLSEFGQTLLNKLTYSKYILSIRQLSEIEFCPGYSYADLLMMYSLTNNGTKLGGRYLTALFVSLVDNSKSYKDLQIKGDLMYRWYKYTSEEDFNQKDRDLFNERDLNIVLAPTIRNIDLLDYHSEPIVKLVKNNGMVEYYIGTFDTKTKIRKYSKIPMKFLKNLDSKYDKETAERMLQVFITECPIFLPTLHENLLQNNFLSKDNGNLQLNTNIFNTLIRQGKILIYKDC